MEGFYFLTSDSELNIDIFRLRQPLAIILLHFFEFVVSAIMHEIYYDNGF